MASFEVRIKMNGFQEVQTFFKGTMRRMNNVTVPLKKAQLVMISSIHKNFNFSGRPATWKPLSMSTMISKLKRGLSPKPLIGRTGWLRNKVTAETVGRNKLVVGSSVPYASYHQYGTKRIPKRTFLLFQDKDIDNINKLVTDHIVNGKD